ncbi:MAG: proton-conducting transporter membrane subunit [Myxococcota bacterium]
MSALWVLPPLVVAGAAARLGAGVRHAALLLLAGASVSLAFAVGLFNGVAREERLLDGYLRVDTAARLFLLLVTTVFWGVSIYVVTRTRTSEKLTSMLPRFAALGVTLYSLCALSLLSNHLVLTWVLLEASTLAGTLLVMLRDRQAARRAAWRYLLFSTVGLGLALLGLACLGHAMGEHGHTVTFHVDELITRNELGHDVWSRLGLALILLGYGTKAGLAPMHVWLPETYDEAPPAVTALLAAVQFNAVMLALFRVLSVYRAEVRDLVSTELVFMGLGTMVVATVQLVGTTNYKRFIAYASMNHAGVIAVGLGVGKLAAYGVLLYVFSNALVKAVLFLTCGLIKSHYRTKDMTRLRNLVNEMPFSGMFFLLGTFALLGFAPFGSFLGEVLILSALIDTGHYFVFAAMCFLLTVVFIVTGRALFPMVWGERQQQSGVPRESALSALSNMVFVAILVLLGVFLPDSASDMLQQVANQMGGLP